MIIAKEAKQITTEVRLKALKSVEDKIKNAAEQGLDCVWVEYLDSCVLGELEKAGYKVTYHTDCFDNGEYCISWKD